nr:conopeptide [Conus arenatus]
MKLSCVLILAVLFLMACQLNTADDSTDKEEYRAVKLRDAMRDFIDSRSCGQQGQVCFSNLPCCSGLRCCVFAVGNWCLTSCI